MSVSSPDHVAVSESGAVGASDGSAEATAPRGSVPSGEATAPAETGTSAEASTSETRTSEAGGSQTRASEAGASEAGASAEAAEAGGDAESAPSALSAPSAEGSKAPETRETTFADLGLPDAVVRKLAQNGVTAPFPIQAATIPDALAGRDVLGRGRTGSGKTLSFGLPLLATLAGGYTEKKRPRGIILTPTRELAMQVADALQPYGDVLGLRMKVVCGGTSMGNQIHALERGVDILVATPGRLRDIIGRGACSLDSVQVAVLDEADQMADLGFLPEVTELLDQVPQGGQRMLFSATLDHDIDTLIKRYLNAPVTHEVDPSAGAVTTMSHHILIVKPRDKAPVTAAIAARKGRTIVFVRTQMGADRVAEQLCEAGVRADALHGGMTQGARTRTLADFKDGYVNVLVATDVAARGIHVDGIDLVLNVDPAGDHKDYLHRSGRTARAGRSGTVVSLALPHQRRQTFRLMEDAGVQAKRHIVGGGGVFDPEVAEITGARSMTEVQAESAGRAADQAEREVTDLTEMLERARRRAVGLRQDADLLSLRAARERGEDPRSPAAGPSGTDPAASGAHTGSSTDVPAADAPAADTPAQKASDGTAPAAGAAAPAPATASEPGGPGTVRAVETGPTTEAGTAAPAGTAEGAATQAAAAEAPVPVPRQAGPQDTEDLAAGATPVSGADGDGRPSEARTPSGSGSERHDRAWQRDGDRGGFGRARDRGGFGRDRDRDRDRDRTGGRGYDRRDGDRSGFRRDGDRDRYRGGDRYRDGDRDRAGRGFDRRDDRRGQGREDRTGGFRRDDRGGRSFGQRDQGADQGRGWDRDRDRDRGSFGRDRDRGFERGGDRDRTGGRGYDRRDGDRSGFRRDGDRPGFRRDGDRPGFGRDRDRDRYGNGNRDRDRYGDRDRPAAGRGWDRDKGRDGADRSGFRRDDRGGHRGSDRPFHRDRRDDRPGGPNRSGGHRPGGQDRPGTRRDDHRGGGSGSASGGATGQHRRREDKPRWKRNG